MTNLLWLLLPVAAFSGWYAAQKQMQRAAQSKGTREFNAQYYEGVSFLLSEQPDKALDVFVKMLEVNSETVELHLALGSLFRRRGEVDRAIVLHQNLMTRPNLEPKQRDHALLELARDYLKAGLLDRAERLFLDLRGSPDYGNQALAGLVDVYQHEKDWERAITAAKEYQKATGKKQSIIIANYYCEMAERSRQKNEKEKVPNFIKQALQADPDSVRANIMLAEYEMEMLNYKAASKAYLRVLDQDTRFISLVIEPLTECCEKLGESSSLFKQMNAIIGDQRYHDHLEIMRSRIEKHPVDQAALVKIETQLFEAPNTKSLARYVELVNEQDTSPSEAVSKISSALRSILDRSANFKCEQCGYASRALYWQCPSCKTWGSVKPV